jgi:hypothetical protein
MEICAMCTDFVNPSATMLKLHKYTKEKNRFKANPLEDLRRAKDDIKFNYE